MKEGIARLIAVLGEQLETQTALLALSQRKTEAIASGELAALQGITEEEQQILYRIRQVESRQSDCVEELAAVFGKSPQELRLSAVIEGAQGEQRAALQTLRERLTDLVDRQVHANEINKKLLNLNMEYIRFVFNRSAPTAPTYDNSGTREAPVPLSRLLDRKV